VLPCPWRSPRRGNTARFRVECRLALPRIGRPICAEYAPCQARLCGVANRHCDAALIPDAALQRRGLAGQIVEKIG
jgi:hypothetical protein